MSHRLQVLLDESEMDDIRRIAKRHKLTVAEWVRQTLRAARRNEPLMDANSKLNAVRRAARYSFSTSDPPEMIAEIDGRQAGETP
jgi:hypothetical protein